MLTKTIGLKRHTKLRKFEIWIPDQNLSRLGCYSLKIGPFVQKLLVMVTEDPCNPFCHHNQGQNQNVKDVKDGKKRKKEDILVIFVDVI
jgi:hypothetical protein